MGVTTTKRPNSSVNMLHVTNLLSKEPIFVQIRWTHCNKPNNFQCYQYQVLIRVLPDGIYRDSIFPWVACSYHEGPAVGQYYIPTDPASNHPATLPKRR